jgi:hypothetical protein
MTKDESGVENAHRCTEEFASCIKDVAINVNMGRSITSLLRSVVDIDGKHSEALEYLIIAKSPLHNR